MAVSTFLHPGCTYVYMLRARLYYDMYMPLLRHVRTSTMTRARLYINREA